MASLNGRHYQDLSIEKQFEDSQIRFRYGVLNETVSPTSSDKSASPFTEGAANALYSTRLPYPRALYNAVITKIRAEHKVVLQGNIIKAYLLRDKHKK